MRSATPLAPLEAAWLLSSSQFAGGRVGRGSGRIGIAAVSWDHRRVIDAGGRYRSPSASVPESGGGMRLSFPSRDPGREVSQPNVVVGPCHRPAPRAAPSSPWPQSPVLPIAGLHARHLGDHRPFLTFTSIQCCLWQHASPL